MPRARTLANCSGCLAYSGVMNGAACQGAPRVMSPLSASSWRHFLLLSLLLAGLAFGIRNVTGDPAKALSFVFTDIDNRTIRLADYRGKWVLVSFWAPWCPLCKVQIPSLNTLNQRPDFRVIGIALEYGDDEAAIREAVSVNRLRYEAHVAGGSRRQPNAAFRQVGPVDFFPTSYLYDPTGEIVLFIPGQLRIGRIVSFMDSWYAEKGGAKPFAAKPEKLAAFLRQRYGERGNQAYLAWKRLLDDSVSATPVQRLARVNDFFNQRIQAGDGRRIWGRPDYWATPGEVLGSGRGASEDLAIAKYFTLLALNIAPEQLRLVYVQPGVQPAVQPRVQARGKADVKARGATRGSPVHMVLAWYEASGRDPLLLDNRAAAILPAAKRPDLQPVYSFNSLGVWDETAKAVAAGEPGRLATWEDTLRRARAEGFE
jgi:predicted transglutaminase-like cysteine proteinase